MAKGFSKKSLTGLSKEEEQLAGVSGLGDLDGFRADLRKEFGAGTALNDDDNIILDCNHIYHFCSFIRNDYFLFYFFMDDLFF